MESILLAIVTASFLDILFSGIDTLRITYHRNPFTSERQPPSIDRSYLVPPNAPGPVPGPCGIWSGAGGITGVTLSAGFGTLS